MMYNRPQDDSLALSVGVRSSFAVEEDNSKSQDTDNESSSSDLEIPYLEKPMSGGGCNITKAQNKPICMSISFDSSLSSAQENSENGLQNGEYVKEGKVKIPHSGPEPRQLHSPHHSHNDTHQGQSGHNQKRQTQLRNHEQDPHMHHEQEHHKFSPVQLLNQVYTPQGQQPCLNYGQQIPQFPLPVDPQYIPIYQPQVQASPSPQPAVYQLTSQSPQYGQPLLIQPSPLVAPQEFGPLRSISTTPTVDLQQYPWQEVSCSDTQSVSSVGSSFPSVVSTPVFGSYYDPNLGNQLMISPLSTQCYPQSQAITQNVVPSQDMPPFYLNAQGCSISSDMNCNINEMRRMTLPSSIPRQPQMKLETASANTRVNIAPPQNIKSESQVSLTTKGRDGAIWTKSFSYKEEQQERLSNLYVNWTGTADQLIDELEQKNLEVHCIQTTAIKDLWNVVFDSHSSARKAFTTQRELKIRMVPPRRSKKNWFRNPSPKFLVQYETKCRLDVREGKAVVHDLVGVLLMSRSSCQERKGCHIWADQLKGHRIRIVGCVGKFMFPSKRVINMKEIPPKAVGNDPIGWVSYRNRHTREEYVTRISGNLLQEYIYNG